MEDLHEQARKGDLLKISTLVQHAFATEIEVEAEMYAKVMLWLKLKTSKRLDPQRCSRVVSRLLDEVKPENIYTIRITQVPLHTPNRHCWDTYLSLKQGKFVEDKKSNFRTNFIFSGLVFIALLFYAFTYYSNPKGSSSTISFSTESSAISVEEARKFLGRSQTGYELWADKDCVYVKGITSAGLARLNTDVWRFKKEVESQTGYTCVLFE